MTTIDRLDQIEQCQFVVTTAAPGTHIDEENELIDRHVPALVAALRAVLEEIDKRGKQAREALPPSLAALAVPSYQFNVRASDVIRAIEEALS